MTPRRDYFDGCMVSHALDIVGERWALLVVRELLLGPKRFTDLRAGLPNAGPNVLSQRLRELEAAGVLRRRRLPPPAASSVYELTEWGRDLEPVLVGLGRWAVGSPARPTSERIGVDSLVLALRALFEPALAVGLDGVVLLELDGQPFRARVEHARLELERGAVDAPDAVVRADADALAPVVFEGLTLDRLVARGAVEVEGDERLAARLLACFPLPPAPDHGPA